MAAIFEIIFCRIPKTRQRTAVEGKQRHSQPRITKFQAMAGLADEGGMMLNLMRAFMRNDSGATAIEYGLIAGMISLVIIGSLPSLGSKVNAKFSKIATALS